MATCRRQTVLSLFIFLFSIVVNTGRFTDGHGNSDGIKVELIHRHDLERQWRNGAQPVTRLQHLRQLLHGDAIRLETISQKARAKKGSVSAVRRQVQETNTYHSDCNGDKHNVSGELALYSGADSGSGQYFVQLRVGSPARKFVLIADTGSDLTWMNCRYGCRGRKCGRRSNRRPVFRADRSSSFRTLPCSSSVCKVDLSDFFSLVRCPSPMSPCTYDYRYADGSSAKGLFADETVTFGLGKGGESRLHNVVVGCTLVARGQSLEMVDGIMGLGYHNYSLAVKAAKIFGGKFSYCLVDHLSDKNVSSSLIFGSHKEVGITVHKMHYTELVPGVISSYYAVNLRGISIGGSMLDIPAETWNVNGVGGVIVDSGSTLTALSQPAYKPVMDALKLSLKNFRKLNLDIVPMEYCFNSTGFRESMVPRLVFHFADGARFEPPVKSFVIDVAPEVRCLGFAPVGWPGVSVIGNIMQQNHVWEFDLANGRLGFAISSCA